MDAPVNRFLSETLSLMAAGEIPRERYAGKQGVFLEDLKSVIGDLALREKEKTIKPQINADVH